MHTPATFLYRFNNLGQLAALFDSYAQQGRHDQKSERADAFAQSADIVRRTTLMKPDAPGARQSFTSHPPAAPPMPDGRPREWVPTHSLGHIGPGYAGNKTRARPIRWAGVAVIAAAGASLLALAGGGVALVFAGGWQ